MPLAALAAILLYVAYNMFEWHSLPRMMRLTLSYRVLILELHKLINLDVTCLEALEQIHGTRLRHHGRLILCGPNHQPRTMMERGGFLERLGLENCVRDLDAALALVKDEALAA